MYTGATSIPIDAVIKYQDGKTSRIKTTLAIRRAKREPGVPIRDVEP